MIERDTVLSADEAWQRLTDWESHGRHIPFTVVTSTGSARRRRVAFTPVRRSGHSGSTTRWRSPPGIHQWTTIRVDCRIEKRGSVVIGWAELSVASDRVGSARAVGRSRRASDAAGSVLDAPARLLSQRVFGRLVDRLLAAEPGQQSAPVMV